MLEQLLTQRFPVDPEDLRRPHLVARRLAEHRAEQRLLDEANHQIIEIGAGVLAETADALAGGRSETPITMVNGVPTTSFRCTHIAWQMAQDSGLARQFKGFAEQCMAEYDLDGWTEPDLITPDDINLFLTKPR